MNFLSLTLYVMISLAYFGYSEGACVNEPDGTFLPDPSSRSRFIYCWGGVENIGTCDPGFEFNPFDRVCDDTIGSGPSPPGQNNRDACYNRPDGTFLRDPSSRNRFIYCSNGQSIIGTCNAGQEFNPMESVCENPPPVSREPCFNRPDGTFLADPSSRNRFLYCSNGQSTPGYCPDNQVFFEQEQYCGPDETASPPAPPPPVRTTTARPLPTTRQPLPTRTTQRPALPTRTSQGPALPTRSSQGPALPTRSSQGPAIPTRRPVPDRQG